MVKHIKKRLHEQIKTLLEYLELNFDREVNRKELKKLIGKNLDRVLNSCVKGNKWLIWESPNKDKYSLQPQGFEYLRSLRQEDIQKSQTDILHKQYIVNRFVFGVLFLSLVATVFIGYQTIKIQSNEPEIVLATSEQDDLVNLNYWENYPFENYIIYIHNKGNAPCYNLKLHNVKFVESFNRIIRAESNDLIEGSLDVKKEYRTLLKPTNCLGNLASSPDEILEPTCYLDIGIIQPNEIIPIGVMVDIQAYNKFKDKMYDQKKFIKKDDAMIKFDIKASCGKSKYELPIVMTDSIENPQFDLIKDNVYGS
ncbi:MAG: hypothetical protein AABX74_02000 [Nanoarchaeota archaeon]